MMAVRYRPCARSSWSSPICTWPPGRAPRHSPTAPAGHRTAARFGRARRSARAGAVAGAVPRACDLARRRRPAWPRRRRQVPPRRPSRSLDRDAGAPERRSDARAPGSPRDPAARAAERARLAADFRRNVRLPASSSCRCRAGSFCCAPGIAALPVTEPRAARARNSAGLPQGTAAAALRRPAAEIEMWLHGQRWSACARRLPVTRCGCGAPRAPARRPPRARHPGRCSPSAATPTWTACASAGSRCAPLPQDLAGIISTAAGAGGAGAAGGRGVAERHAELCARHSGGSMPLRRPGARGAARRCVAAVALIVNDTLRERAARSTLRRWRRTRAPRRSSREAAGGAARRAAAGAA